MADSLYGSQPAGSYADLYNDAIPQSYSPTVLVSNYEFIPYNLTDYPVIKISNTGTQEALLINNTGLIAALKAPLYVTSTAAQTTGLGLSYLYVANTASTIPCETLKSVGTGPHLRILPNANTVPSTEGDFAYDGTHLYFKPAGTVVDLLQVSPSGSTNTLVVNEVPSGLVNGVNTDFVFLSTFVSGTMQLYRDGQLMKPGAGNDYIEVSPKTVRFSTAPVTGSNILGSYQAANTLIPGGFVNPMTSAGDIIYGGVSGVPTRLPIGAATYVLKVNAGGTAPEWGVSTDMTTSEVTGTTQAMSVQNIYIANNSSQVVLTLPSTAEIGKEIEVVGKGAGGFKVAQNANQYIRWAAQTTTVGTGGYIQSVDQYCVFRFRCTTTDNGWTVISSIGTFILI